MRHPVGKIDRRNLFKISGAALLAGTGFPHSVWSSDGGVNPPLRSTSEEAADRGLDLLAAPPLIFPQPCEMAIAEKKFSLEESIIFLQSEASTHDSFLARLLTDELSGQYNLQLRTQRVSRLPDNGRAIVMGSVQNPLVQEYCAQQHVELAPLGASPEAYLLHISERGVLIAGTDDAGAFYDLQSLRQLIMKNDLGI